MTKKRKALPRKTGRTIVRVRIMSGRKVLRRRWPPEVRLEPGYTVKIDGARYRVESVAVTHESRDRFDGRGGVPIQQLTSFSKPAIMIDDHYLTVVKVTPA